MRLAPLLLVALVLAGCVSLPGSGDDAGAGAPVAGYARVCDAISRGAAAAWPEPCLAFASPNDSPSKAEIDLVVDPTDPQNVVVGSKDLDTAASPCVWAVPQVSKDGGESWTSVYIGGKQSERAPGDPLFGWQCITDPIMTFDAEGTLYYSLQAYDHTVEGGDVPIPGNPLVGSPTILSSILMARSSDGGETWEKIITLHAGDGINVFHDFMRMASNPATGSVYTIWNQYNQNSVGVPVVGGVAGVIPVLVASRDGGDTAAPPTYVQVPNIAMSSMAVATEGTVYVSFEGDGGAGLLATSTDDARSFSTPVAIPEWQRVPLARQAIGDDAFRTTGSYELAVDNSGGARDGWIYATISDYTDDDANLYVSHSEDKGATWSAPVLLNEDDHVKGFQWMARPYVDRLGNLHVVYLDSSRNAQPNMLDATWALSTDGGATFTNTYLTNASFDGNKGIHQDGFAFIGDYIGIGGAGDVVYMGFPTTVTGRAEIAVAKVSLPTTA
ncbi:MAG TPA: sialidase family protein [Candidatus Thermoplasmatota archaeon]|nr:sialidase family protein [Candidatus Thermoplasmatota archaeon]